MTCIDQRVILAYVQIFMDFREIRFKFHDQVNQRLISFQSVIPGTAQDEKRFYAFNDLWSFAQMEISIPDRLKGLTFDRTHDQRTNA
jgi:hypothetical protein